MSDLVRGNRPVDQLFVGRDAELRSLHDALRDARSREPRIVVLRGAPGIGKSALLRRFLAEIDDVQVLAATCDEAETDLAYGLIGQLVSRVPQPTLREFTLLADGTAPPTTAPFQVGAELLELFGHLQRVSPLLLLVDDLPWADPQSVQALGFVLRRLYVDRVLAIFVARSESSDPITESPRAEIVRDDEGWRRLVSSRDLVQELRLGGLSTTEVVRLARESGAAGVTLPGARRLQDVTEGHPLYLRMVLADLPRDGWDARDVGVRVPPSLAAAVNARASGLPDESRSLLEAAAVLDSRSPLRVVASLAGIPDAAAALEPLLTSGLVRWWPDEASSPIQIVHKLQRDVVYAGLGARRRRDLHARAATLVDRHAAWAHRVAASDRADPQLADELAQAAGDLVAAHDVERAATLLLWAAELSGVRGQHENRLLSAVSHLLINRHNARAEPLRASVESCAPSLLRTQVLGQFALSRGAFAQADRLLTDAVSQSAGVEGAQDVAAVAGTRLAGLRAWQGRGEEAVACARRALESPEIEPHVALRATIYLVEGTLLSRGAGPALEVLDAATASHRTVAGPGDAYQLAWRGGVLMFSGELAAAAESLSAARRAAANGSAVDAEVISRLWTAYTMYLLGEWDEANISSDQAAAIAFAEEWQWAYVPIHAVAAIVAAGRGEWDRSAHHTEQAQLWSRSSPPGFAVFPCLAAAAVAQARDDPAAMLDALGPMREGHADGWPRVLEPWWRPMLIEALARAQNLDEARVELDRLAEIRDEARYLRLAHDWLSGLVAEESGDLARARECYERGLAPGMSAIDPPLLRARLEHSYGRISLTSRARRTFSGWLGTAHERFLSLRAVPFAERCALDMVAAGMSERQPEADPLDTLTDRERSIARLIAGGATNREVARELFVSIKTVEYHLGHIYAKLGVSSRSQLRAMLRPA